MNFRVIIRQAEFIYEMPMVLPFLFVMEWP